MILIDGYAFDASLSETHTRSAETTEFPVESGSDFTDHIRQQPIELTIEGIVSNTPIGAMRVVRDLEEFAGGFVDDQGKSITIVADALAHLEAIFERRQPVTIQSALKIYERMAITSLEIPKDRETGNAMLFTLTARQIKIVTNVRTAQRVKTPGGAKKKNLGTLPSRAAESKALADRMAKAAQDAYIAENPHLTPQVTHTGTPIGDVTLPSGGYVPQEYQQLVDPERELTQAEKFNRIYGQKLPGS